MPFRKRAAANLRVSGTRGKASIPLAAARTVHHLTLACSVAAPPALNFALCIPASALSSSEASSRSAWEPRLYSNLVGKVLLRLEGGAADVGSRSGVEEEEEAL